MHWVPPCCSLLVDAFCLDIIQIGLAIWSWDLQSKFWQATASNFWFLLGNRNVLKINLPGGKLSASLKADWTLRQGLDRKTMKNVPLGALENSFFSFLSGRDRLLAKQGMTSHRFRDFWPPLGQATACVSGLLGVIPTRKSMKISREGNSVLPSRRIRCLDWIVSRKENEALVLHVAQQPVLLTHFTLTSDSR